MKAKVDFFTDTYHPKKDGTCNIKIRVYFNRKYMYYSTDIDLKPDELEKVLTAKRRTPDQKEILKKLNRYYQKAENIIDKLDTAFTFEKFAEMYLEGRDVYNSVYHVFDKYISDLETEGRISTASSYRCAKNSLENFKKNLMFTDITPSFLKEYERWMLDNGKSITTVGMYLRALRAIFNQQNIDSKLSLIHI